MLYFARTRYDYDSYTDFWRLVELSGFPIVYVDEVEWYNREHAYIISPVNGELNTDNARQRQCGIFLWNLERPGDGTVENYRQSSQKYVDVGLADAIIVSDRHLAKLTNFHYVPVGVHEGLGAPGVAKSYHYIHLMCYSLRRSFMFDYLTPLSKFYGMTIAPNGWGKERDLALMASNFMLNIHQDNFPFIEPLRFALASMYGLPIVSEYSEDTFPYEQQDVHQFPLGSNAYRTAHFMNTMWSGYHFNLSAAMVHRQRLLDNFSFRHCIERYL